MTLNDALDQIRFAREYSLKLIDTFPIEDWYRQPAEGVTHLAWQVGHLAMAQYRLVLDRVRGAGPGDEDLISTAFLDRYSRGSMPGPRQDSDPDPAEIRAVLDRVHRTLLEDMSGFPDSELDVPGLKPHAFCATKRQCLAWCGQHEMMHAGQIGLLRRLLGSAPVW